MSFLQTSLHIVEKPNVHCRLCVRAHVCTCALSVCVCSRIHVSACRMCVHVCGDSGLALCYLCRVGREGLGGGQGGPWGRLGGGRVSTSTQTRPRGRPASGTSFVRVRGHRGGPSRGPSPLAAVGAEGLSSEPPTLAHAFLTAQGQKLGLPGRPGRRCRSPGMDGGGILPWPLGAVLLRTRAWRWGHGFRGRARMTARAQLTSVRAKDARRCPAVCPYVCLLPASPGKWMRTRGTPGRHGSRPSPARVPLRHV